MKVRVLATKLLAVVGVMVVCLTLCLSGSQPVDNQAVRVLAEETPAVTYEAPSYLFNQEMFNYDKSAPEPTSLLADLGIVEYNEYLMDLNNNRNLPLNEVYVAVIDSGVDTSHPVFGDHAERIAQEYATNFYTRFNRHTTGYNSDDWNIDESGHGTHVAGIIADSTLANVKIIPIRIFGGTGNNLGDSAYNNAVNYVCALKTGRQVYLNGKWYNRSSEFGKNPEPINIVAVNLSLGTAGIEDIPANEGNISETNNAYQGAINSLCGAGILPVVASGNIDEDVESNKKSYFSFPSSCAGAVSVSAYNFYEDYALANFSYHNRSITISAPGVEIWSACSQSVYDYYKTKNRTMEYHDAKYLRLNGTSMATPFVVVCYAMIMSDPTKTTCEALGIDSWYAPIDQASPYYYVTMQEKALLLHAVDLYLLDEAGLNDSFYGYGGVNVSAFAHDQVELVPSKTNAQILQTTVNGTVPNIPNSVDEETQLPVGSEWAVVVWSIVGVGLLVTLINVFRSRTVRR